MGSGGPAASRKVATCFRLPCSSLYFCHLTPSPSATDHWYIANIVINGTTLHDLRPERQAGHRGPTRSRQPRLGDGVLELLLLKSRWGKREPFYFWHSHPVHTFPKLLLLPQADPVFFTFFFPVVATNTGPGSLVTRMDA